LFDICASFIVFNSPPLSSSTLVTIAIVTSSPVQSTYNPILLGPDSTSCSFRSALVHLPTGDYRRAMNRTERTDLLRVAAPTDLWVRTSQRSSHDVYIHAQLRLIRLAVYARRLSDTAQ